ncbi:MAG: lipopolysaccharide core heptose(I) kinase RfaP [Victivallales bacterium]|jgi:heptose I phosphotransferase|nr:lipopolysaccharide core heptose(I) kinase RfaP [Victivallales bacterium]
MAEIIDLAPEFAEAWRGRDPFEAVAEIEGEVFRKVKSRRTFRFELNGKGYFAKVHHGVGYREIIKNLLRFKRPVLGAENEYNALLLLHQVGVDTMTSRAYGRRGKNPAKIESFLVTSELKNMTSLEDFCRDWPQNPPKFALRIGLTMRLASMVKTMHDTGMNHRDCYLCHFLLDNATAESANPHLYVIDLHRAEIRDRIPRRYRLKDVAGIYFSSLDIGLTKRDCFRFMKCYSGKSLRQTLRENGNFWRSVERAAKSLYRKEESRNKRRCIQR